MATAHLSLEEFYRRYDDAKPQYEHGYGEAIQKSSATGLHGLVQFVIMLLLRARGWSAASEVRLKLVSDAQPIPDIIADREGIPSLYPTSPVGICVEIMSADDRLNAAIEKGKHYLDWGIQYVWIIDPQSRTAWMMTHDHPDAVWIQPDGSLKAGEDTQIPLAKIFAEVDRMLPRARH